MGEYQEEPTDEEIEYAELQGEYWEEQEDKFPKLIFKYRALSKAQDLARVLDIFQNTRLFMPTASQLNDPFEGGNVDCLSEGANRALSDAKGTHRILALSQDCFSAPLWAHYAANGTGVCIGFYTNRSFGVIEPVEYTSTIDKKQWLCFDPSQALSMEYRYKNSDWAYEHEYRIQSDSDKDYFGFEAAEIACLIFGEAIARDVRIALENAVKPLAVQLFDLKSDINRSRYYLAPCDEPRKEIYEMEGLNSFLMD